MAAPSVVSASAPAREDSPRNRARLRLAALASLALWLATTLLGAVVPTSGRATRNLDRFPIRVEGNTVVVATDSVYRSDQDQGAWSAAHAELPA